MARGLDHKTGLFHVRVRCPLVSLDLALEVLQPREIESDPVLLLCQLCARRGTHVVEDGDEHPVRDDLVLVRTKEEEDASCPKLHLDAVPDERAEVLQLCMHIPA